MHLVGGVGGGGDGGGGRGGVGGGGDGGGGRGGGGGGGGRTNRHRLFPLALCAFFFFLFPLCVSLRFPLFPAFLVAAFTIISEVIVPTLHLNTGKLKRSQKESSGYALCSMRSSTI